ncbi:MAG: hypothetical protein WCR19_05070 [Acholeplasmataceae bacterium]
MKRSDKFLVILASYFYAVLGLFFTGWWIWFLVIVFAGLWVFIGGKKHV